MTGPGSATSGNVPSFNGTTGKIVADSGFNISNAAIDTSATRAPTSGSVKTYVDNAVSGITQYTPVAGETPSGAVDGSNAAFVLAHTPVVGSVSVWVNGVLQTPGSGLAYTITTDTITFETNSIPLTGDDVLVAYSY